MPPAKRALPAHYRHSLSSECLATEAEVKWLPQAKATVQSFPSPSPSCRPHAAITPRSLKSSSPSSQPNLPITALTPPTTTPCCSCLAYTPDLSILVISVSVHVNTGNGHLQSHALLCSIIAGAIAGVIARAAVLSLRARVPLRTSIDRGNKIRVLQNPNALNLVV